MKTIRTFLEAGNSWEEICNIVDRTLVAGRDPVDGTAKLELYTTTVRQKEQLFSPQGAR